MIRDAFSPDPRNEQLETYLSSVAASAELARYNVDLSDFRAQLRKHIAYVDGEIARVQRLQAERIAARSLGPKQRFASFWSFEIAASPAPKSPCPSRRRGIDDEKNDELSGEQDTQAKAKKERIEKLRREGWVVRKEKHGFKGEAFYDELCRRVEAELNGYY